MGSARERLAQISHHFLSDDDESAAPPACPVVSLILSHAPGHEAHLPLSLLAEALCRHGAPGVAIMPGPTANSVSLHVPWDAHGAAERNMESGRVFATLRNGLKERGSPPYPYLLYATTCVEASPLADGAQCLMLVQANHEGLRKAYARLKALTERDLHAPIGVAITGAASSRSARYHYTKLATAAQRFLSLHVTSYGALPLPPPSWGATEDQAGFQTDAIHHIARMIIQDWQDYQQSLTEERTPT